MAESGMVESPRGSSSFFEDELKTVLEQCLDRGRFEAAVLSAEDGLPIVAVESTLDEDALGGLNALFAEVTERALAILGWSEIEEVSLVGRRRTRLVIRRFQAGGRPHFLIVVLAASMTWRRATNKAMRRLARLIDDRARGAEE